LIDSRQDQSLLNSWYYLVMRGLYSLKLCLKLLVSIGTQIKLLCLQVSQADQSTAWRIQMFQGKATTVAMSNI